MGPAAALGIGLWSDVASYPLQDMKNEQARRHYGKSLGISNKYALDMWKQTNYPAQVDMLKRAGLNPGLMYGMSGGGGATATPTGGNAQNTASRGMDIQGAAQLALLKAQTENIEADTAQKQATTTKTAGVDTDKTKSETENNVLNSIILKYAGKEAKDTYERVTSPNRGVQAKTYQEELEARQAQAGTIYELWKEGKLYDKGNAEIEQLLLNNAKTREETRNIIKQFDILEENLKGAKLSNAILELEKDMQTKLGIDKTAPIWMKLLGRLFLSLTEQ